MKILQFILPAVLLFACNTRQQNDTLETSGNQEAVHVPSDTVYLDRNTAVTATNSYSDLFLDSNAINEFISTNNLPADDQKWLRSFYNYRNMQFAWFSSQGFTEQAKGFWNLKDKMGVNTDKRLSNKMDTLLNMDTLTVANDDTTIAATEL